MARNKRLGLRGLTCVVSAVLALALAGCGASKSSNAPHELVSGGPSAWYDAAKKEGTVMWYTSSQPQEAGAVQKAFEAKYPGVKLQYFSDTDNNVTSRFDAEVKSKRCVADLVGDTLGTNMRAYADQGVFTPIQSQNISDSDWAGTPWLHKNLLFTESIYPWGIAYNTNIVKTAPTSYDDVLNLGLKAGQLSGYDNLSKSVAQIYGFIESKTDDTWLQRFAAQKPQLLAGSAPTFQALSSGEVAVSVTATGSVLAVLTEKGAPVNFVVPQSGGMATPTMTGVSACAPHPNAAQLLADFLTAKDGQEAITDRGKVSPIPGIKNSLVMASQLEPISDELSSDRFANAFKTKWQKLFG